jgi:hypothetical protein
LANIPVDALDAPVHPGRAPVYAGAELRRLDQGQTSVREARYGADRRMPYLATGGCGTGRNRSPARRRSEDRLVSLLAIFPEARAPRRRIAAGVAPSGQALAGAVAAHQAVEEKRPAIIDRLRRTLRVRAAGRRKEQR